MLSAKQLCSIVAFSAFLTVASAQGFGCTRYGIVKEGDTCNIFAARHNVSTFQLANCNGINHRCDLFPGEEICLGKSEDQDCQNVVVVQPGDSCISIATAAGIPAWTLMVNNPNLSWDCSNIQFGEVLCVDSTLFNYTEGEDSYSS